MIGRGLFLAAGLFVCLGAWIVSASAQVRIEVPTVEVPDRRPNPNTGVDMGELVGGLFALRDGYDRSRRGFICVPTYDDANGNGRRDRGEGPLPGWGFTIADAAGGPAAQGQSNKDGRFCNERPLNPGAYSVRQSTGGGWSNTEPGAPTPDFKPVSLPPDKSITVLFGNCRGEGCTRGLQDETRGETRAGPGGPTPQGTAQVCVVKYQDYDGDGVRDTGEPGLPGWIFSVKTTSGTMLAFGTTNASGEWCSTATLAPGAINVFETAQTDWISTDPAGVPTGSVPTKPGALVAGQTTNVVFGNKTARVCVVKFNDLNGDGVKNTGEPVLPGWAFTLQGVTGTTLDSGVTDAQGQWCSTAILPVGYPVSVIETQQAGWWNSAPGGSYKLSPTPTVILAMTAGQTANLKFGNWIPPSTGKVCVRKFRDLNSDGGESGLGEPSLPGWTFTITGPSGSITLVTGANGSACTQANLAPGSYTVTETLQSGWTNTNPGNATASKVVNVNPTGVTNVVFGNVPVAPGILCATKYRSLDYNSWYDMGVEPVLGAGWTFEVRNASGAVVATGTTNAQGRWCTTTPLPAGTYTVNEVQQSGWVNSDPNGPPNFSPPYFKSALVSATRGADLFFGNMRSGRVCVTKYNDLNGNGHRDAGEPVMAGFSFHFQSTSSAHATDVILTTGPTGVVCLDLPPAPVSNGGGYWVNEIPKPGWVITEPYGLPAPHPSTGHVFPIVEGQTTNLMFGNHQASLSGRICVTKFNDLNGNGVRNTGEPQLPYWQFNVTGPSGPLSGTTSYPGGGWCTLQVLNAGTYTVTEVTKPGWIRTAPSGTTPTMTAAVTNGQTTTLNFGNRLPGASARVCVTKFNDANNNGVRDAGETLMFGWSFAVRNAAGGLDDTGITSLQPYFGSDPTGVWCSTLPLAAGPATVVETQNPGWTSTTPGGATPTKPITLVAGQTTNVEFGNYHVPPAPGRICAIKFNDLNGNGTRQAGEPVLPGWAFSLTGPSGPLSGTTDAAGRWCTAQTLTPGTYTATETQQAGWISTAPGGASPQLTTVLAAGQTVGLTFGNRLLPAPGRICVVKFKDTNGDGVKQPGEPVLPNWQFTIAGTGVAQSGSTDEQKGQWCTDQSLVPGTYTVTETMKPGWVSSTPGGTTPTLTAAVTAGQTTTVMFGNRQLGPTSGQVCIAKYNDLDGDGVRDPGEPFLPGWAFPLRKTNGVPVGTITTAGATGSGCQSLAPGTYIARETQQAGWTSIDPGPPFDKPFTIVSGQTTTLVFGNRQPPASPLLIVQKAKLTAGPCHGSAPAQNECLFVITVTNTGGSVYTGPLSFTDTLSGAQATVMTSPGLTCPSGPQSGAFTCTAPTTTIPVTGSVQFQVKLFLSSAAPAQNNCVVLNYVAGGIAQSSTACAQIYP